MNFFNFSQKTIQRIFILSLFILISALSLIKISLQDNDLWFHIKAGEYIFNNHQIPKENIFAYTESTGLWVDHSWLFQILVFLINRHFGPQGLCLLRFLIVLSIFFLLYRFVRKTSNRPLSVILVFLGLMIASSRFFLRPQLFSLLFSLVYFFILEAYRNRSSRGVYFLPLLQVLWTNTHGYFILGPLFIFIYCLGTGLSRWSSQFRPYRSSDPQTKVVTLAVIAFTSAFVCLINPNLLKGFIYPITMIYRFIKGPPDRGFIMELLPLARYQESGFLLYFKVLTLLVAASFVLNFKKFSFEHLLVCAFLFCLSLIAQRHIDIFAIVSLPVISFNFAQFCSSLNVRLSRQGLTQRFRLRLLGPPLAVIVSLFLAGSFLGLSWEVATNRFYLRNNKNLEFGLGVLERTYPIGACDFIEKAGLEGKMFNDLNWGSYLIYRFFPDKKVFIDARTEAYPQDLLSLYMNLYLYPNLLEKVESEFGINYCIINYGRGGKDLVRYLYEHRDWKLVYLDEASLIFLKDTESNRPLISAHNINLTESQALDTSVLDEHPAYVEKEGLLKNLTYFLERYPPKMRLPYEHMSRGDLFTWLGLKKLAKEEYLTALEINPDVPSVHNDLANLLFDEGLLEQAIEEYRLAIKLSPRFYLAYFNLGLTLQERGLLDESIGYYEKIPSSSRLLFARARNQLGSIYEIKGLYKKSAAEFKAAIDADPRYADARYNLGIVYGKMMMPFAAKRHIQKALELDPNMKDAQEALDKLKELGY
jgi:tetratricopeptide (TPR) repeat protein